MCLALIGAGILAVGTFAKAQADAASYEAQSQFASRQSSIEAQKGAYEAKRTSDVNDQALARMRGSYLSSGIALSGSAVDVTTDSATQASLDEQAIKYGAKIRSDNYAFESSMAKMNAGQARLGGTIGALGSFVSGINDQINQNAQRTLIRNPYAFG